MIERIKDKMRRETLENQNKLISRRETLKNIGCLATFMAGFTSCTALVAFRLPSKEHSDTYNLFNNDVTITRVETTRSDLVAATYTESVFLHLNINKPGTYLFEEWAIVRGKFPSACEVDKHQYKVLTIPFSRQIQTPSFVNGLIAYRTLDGELEKDRAYFKTYGISDSQNRFDNDFLRGLRKN